MASFKGIGQEQGRKKNQKNRAKKFKLFILTYTFERMHWWCDSKDIRGKTLFVLTSESLQVFTGAK